MLSQNDEARHTREVHVALLAVFTAQPWRWFDAATLELFALIDEDERYEALVRLGLLGLIESRQRQISPGKIENIYRLARRPE